MKVYEVYHSEQDDYRIYFICSTREKAEEAVDKFKKKYGEELDINEWEVDDLSDYLP